MLEKILRRIKAIIPTRVFTAAQPLYHYALALWGAVLYRFPSRDIYVLGVTGTKGKSSVTEITSAILEHAGVKTALVGGIRFKVGKNSTPNKLKMTMPGRLLVQKYLRRAADAECDIAILEMTSEGAKQYRHKFIDLDALIFTNLSPEHIESHGSYENYRAAKLRLAQAVEDSGGDDSALIANRDDPEHEKFLAPNAANKLTYSLDDAKIYRTHADGVELTLEGRRMRSNLLGRVNIANLLAAITFARFWGIDLETIEKAIENIQIPGRLESVDAGQSFGVYVDYAHTEDSLEKLYQTFPGKNKIAVLGATGGGRDQAKRAPMGRLAEKYCREVILTNEDPYDEDPREVIEDVARGFEKTKPRVVLERREAIRKAFELAGPDDVVLISGKGTDPYIMAAGGAKIPWSDARVARGELERMLENTDKPPA